jgi:hypothetical protein
VLAPTPLNWESSDHQRADWSRLEAEGRIQFDAETGDFRIAYTTSNGENKTWVFEPANKLEVDVHTEVAYNAETGVYTYTCTVRNSPTSKQSMRRFAVNHEGTQVWNSSAFPDDPQIEGGWYFASGNMKSEIASWGHTEGGGLGIAPGKTAVFSFQSDSPPGKVRAYANGYVAIPQFADGEAPEDPRPPLNGQAAQGITVGPFFDANASQTKGLVIVRPLLASLGWSLKWDSTQKQVLACRKDRTLSLASGSSTIVLDGKIINMRNKAKLLNNRLHISADIINYIDPVIVAQQNSIKCQM